MQLKRARTRDGTVAQNRAFGSFRLRSIHHVGSRAQRCGVSLTQRAQVSSDISSTLTSYITVHCLSSSFVFVIPAAS